VRLYVKIEGAGLTIQSQPNPSLPVFTLQGGVPLTLGQQIEPYFRTANLLATGNGALQFLQNGVLPEGFFTITITVIEHRRNVQISNPANTYAWIIVNDPPQLVTPSNNQTLEPGGIQNIFISWIPRHVVNPTSGSQISYNLSLWEVPQGFDPQMVVNTLQPLETVSSYSPNVIWGPDKTALTPGKRYVVAVKAIDPNNEVTFKNNGFSAAHSFVYGQPCLTPINLSHSNVFIQTADVAWYALGAAQNFRVEFKAASEANDAWRNLDVNQTNTTISNLAPNTQYSYRVSAVCGSFVSNPTANKSFTTLSIPPLDKECTSDISVPQTDESPLLTSLPAGQLFFAAGFPVEVGPTTQIAPNTFNGKGIITLPLFNFGIRANLKGIKVNHSLQMVAGTVEAVYGDSLVLIGAPGTTQSGPGSVDFSNPNDTIILNTPIDSVYMNDDGTWTVVDTDGDTTVITPGEGGTLVVGSDGNGVVIIDEVAYPITVDTEDSGSDSGDDGSGSGNGSGTGGPVTPTSICSQTVTFAPGGSMHRFGFDAFKEAMPHGTYHTINVGEHTLHLPWKSVATGGSDRLLASPKTDSTLTFAYQGGMPLTGTPTQDGHHVWTINPPGGEDNLLALCQADSSGNASVAGGVRVKTYDLKRHRVAVVPVGSSQPAFTRAELQTALNAIYAQAVTEWEVTLEQPLDATGLTTTLEVNTTDYSEDMRAMMRAYVMQRNTVPGTTYLFIVPGFKDNPSMVGYMPLKSNYGFLTPQATTRDAAHELGHGVFNLRHTFSTNNMVNLPEGTTQNLMDYSAGTELFKYQWDFIHNPEGGWFVGEDSEEGAMDFDFCEVSLKKHLLDIRTANLTNENSISFFWEAKDMKCLQYGVTIGDNVYDLIGFEVNYEEFNGKIDFQPSEYTKTSISSYNNLNAEFIRYDFGHFGSADDEPWIMLTYVIKEEQSDDFEMYLFGEKESDSDKLIINTVTTLIDENEYNTFSSFSIDNGAVTGYFIEREPGTYEEERRSGSLKRIPGNIYEFIEDPCLTGRSNCKNEFRLITVPEKSGTRGGILIHRGADYEDSEGCLITIGNGYTYNEINITNDDGEIIRTIKIYKSNGTSDTTLNNINTYVEQKKQEAEKNDKTLKMYITINR